MSAQAYADFLALPVGALFTSTAEWGEQDAFIKVDEERYRRTYDYITWVASDPYWIRGCAEKDSWPGLRVMGDVPKWISHNPPLTQAQCDERILEDYKRVREHIKRTGEYPEMGFW